MSLEAPRVVKDPELSDFVSNMTVRPEIIGRLMNQGGVALEEIPDHTIHLSADTGGEQNNEGILTYGDFDYPTLTSTIYLGSHHALFTGCLSRWVDEFGPWPPDNWFVRKVRNEVEDFTNEHLFHETKHAIDYSVMGFEAYMAEKSAHYRRARRGPMVASEVLKYGGAIGVGYGLIELMDTPNLYESPTTLIWIGLGATGIIAAQEAVSRKYSSRKHRHNIYMEAPSEVRARQYATDQLGKVHNKSEYPLRVKFRMPSTLPAA